jgi:hypothetical protein
MMKDEGIAEIGYVYTFIISSILLTAMTMMSTDMVNDSGNAALRIMLSDVAEHVESEIGSVVAYSMRSPNSTVEKVVQLQPIAFTFNYRISATDHILYVNSSTDPVDIRRPIMNPGNIEISGSVASSMSELIIRYENNGAPQITLVS